MDKPLQIRKINTNNIIHSSGIYNNQINDTVDNPTNINNIKKSMEDFQKLETTHKEVENIELKIEKNIDKEYKRIIDSEIFHQSSNKYLETILQNLS